MKCGPALPDSVCYQYIYLFYCTLPIHQQWFYCQFLSEIDMNSTMDRFPKLTSCKSLPFPSIVTHNTLFSFLPCRYTYPFFGSSSPIMTHPPCWGTSPDGGVAATLLLCLWLCYNSPATQRDTNEVYWEPERHYCSSKMFCWEAEGRYRCTKSTVIATFWFSGEHLWTAIMPFWLSTDDVWIFIFF